MAGLKNLIRLHEWTVDERRRELGMFLRRREELDRRLEDLEAELKREQALAGSNPGGVGVTFGAYYNMVRIRRHRLEQQIRAAEADILEARDILSRAYMELKKYQVAQDVRTKKEELEAAREEQRGLDELALQLYRRKAQKR